MYFIQTVQKKAAEVTHLYIKIIYIHIIYIYISPSEGCSQGWEARYHKNRDCEERKQKKSVGIHSGLA